MKGREGLSKETLTREIKEIAYTVGADLVGIAPVNRFDEGPKELHPKAYMNDAQCVIVILMGIPYAIGEVWGYRVKEGVERYMDAWGQETINPKTAGPYLWLGYGLLNYELNFAAARVARFVERRGYKALPIPATGMPHRFFQMGDFSHRHAAVAAGLGELGWNRLLITPQFGAYQRLISVITNAPLAGDPMYEGPPLCDREKCGDKCMENCPVNAFVGEVSCRIGGREFRYSGLDQLKCRWAVAGLYRGTGSITHIDIPENPTRKDLAEALKKRDIRDNQMFIFGNVNFCGRCLHVCPSAKYRGW